MLRSVQTYRLNADYRRLLDHVFRSGERSPLDNRRCRRFQDDGGNGIRECFLFESSSIGYAACVAAIVGLDMGPNWQFTTGYNRYAVGGGNVRRDVHSHAGMFITLDQKRKEECVSELWLEEDAREWLGGLYVQIEQGHWLVSRRHSEPVQFDRIQDRSAVLPDWLPTYPGKLAMDFCQKVWREIIDEWEAYLKGFGADGPDAEPEQAARSGDDRQRLEDSDRWDWIVEKVGEYQGFINNGLSQTGAARKVKNAEGHPIPRTTLNGWRDRVRKKQGDDLTS